MEELKNYIKENSPLILEYINKEILKDIGVMSQGFFVRLIDEYFNKKEKRLSTDNLTADTLAYYLITEILGDARQAFPFYRKDTMTLDTLYKDVKVYFNYVKFTIEDDTFNISLIQTKAGVNKFENEIAKFSKQFPMKTSGVEEFISENSNIGLDEDLIKMKKDIENII